jgi:serine/threonine-protein kinase
VSTSIPAIESRARTAIVKGDPAIGQARLSASADSITDGDQEGLQQRLTFFATWAFAMSFGFSVLMFIVLLATGCTTASDFIRLPSNQLHQVANLVLLAGALVGRYTKMSRRALSVFDVVLVLAVTWIFGMLFVTSPPRVRPELVATLTTMTICIFRAVLIPSTALRTTILTALGAAPGVVVAWVVHRDPAFIEIASGRVNHLSITLNIGIWWLVQVIVATLTTRIIYGLRQRVREARQFGQYVLEQRLGEGGMGVVYRASHALLRRPTAIKLLGRQQVGDRALQRFSREVRLTARLTHPNTVTIYDYGRTEEGVFYYAMELLDGIDLQELVRQRGPLPPARVRHVLVQIGQALAEAHAIGLIHRDVKPANIMLCTQIGRYDVAKLLDFGLVKDLEETVDATRSASQALTGTPLYMAPEAITHPDTIDLRADIYALGAVGYFLLVGAPVFDGRTTVEVCTHHMHTTPTRPSDRIGERLPSGLEGVLLRCLAKKAVDRYQSANEMVAALLSLDDVEAWTQVHAEAQWISEREVREEARRESADVSPTAQGVTSHTTRGSGGSAAALNIDWRSR